MKKSLLEKYTPDELDEKHSSFMKLIDDSFGKDRASKLKVMYNNDNLGQELVMAPASGKLNYHNCYIGGYIDHIMNVIENSKISSKFYEHAGGDIDFTEEELIFAAMHHDLGKLGDVDGPYYIPQESTWHQEKRHEYFTHNTNIQWMSPPERGLYLLNKFGVTFTWKEMLGIKLADGMYDESNAFYLKTFDPAKRLQTSIGYVIHMGDFVACCSERDTFMREHGDLFQ